MDHTGLELNEFKEEKLRSRWYLPDDFKCEQVTWQLEQREEVGHESLVLDLEWDQDVLMRVSLLNKEFPNDEPAVLWETNRTAQDVLAVQWQEATTQVAPPTLDQMLQSDDWWQTFIEWAQQNQVEAEVRFLRDLETKYKPSPTYDWSEYLLTTYLEQGQMQVWVDPSQVDIDLISLGARRIVGASPDSDLFDPVAGPLKADVAQRYPQFLKFIDPDQGQPRGFTIGKNR
jgi:hypothetical protein